MIRSEKGNSGHVFVLLLMIAFVLFTLASSAISVNVCLRRQNLNLARYVQSRADDIKIVISY